MSIDESRIQKLSFFWEDHDTYAVLRSHYRGENGDPAHDDIIYNVRDKMLVAIENDAMADEIIIRMLESGSTIIEQDYNI